MASNAFHKAECNVCQRTTWHYKEGTKNPRCTDHSDYVQGRRHAIVSDAVQTGLHEAHALTEQELRVVNRLDRSLWRVAEERRSTSVVLDDEWAKDIFPEAEVQPTLDPTKRYCSFCGNETDKINSLSEKKATIRRVEEPYVTDAGEFYIRERITSKVETVHSCPNCVLNIRKPIIVKRV